MPEKEKEPGSGDPVGPFDWRKLIPFEPAASSGRLGWAGLEAARYRASPAWEYSAPALTHHRLVLAGHAAAARAGAAVRGGEAARPAPAGSVILVPAGTPGR